MLESAGSRVRKAALVNGFSYFRRRRRCVSSYGDEQVSEVARVPGPGIFFRRGLLTIGPLERHVLRDRRCTNAGHERSGVSDDGARPGSRRAVHIYHRLPRRDHSCSSSAGGSDLLPAQALCRTDFDRLRCRRARGTSARRHVNGIKRAACFRPKCARRMIDRPTTGSQ
jgi:hypothetical protein